MFSVKNDPQVNPNVMTAFAMLNELLRRLDKSSPSKPESTDTQSLCVSAKNLIEVPISIFQYNGLQKLDFSRNKITILPPDIQLLVSLQHLNVSRNSLRNLPVEIAKLQNLTTLNALSNSLNQRTLPLSEIASMKSLQVLDLRYNQKCKSLDLIKSHWTPHHLIDILVTPQKKMVRDPAIVGAHACDRDATKLRSQLEPWGTPHLRRRLRDSFGVETDPEIHRRDYVMDKLLDCYNKEGPRSIRRITPKLQCRSDLYDALLKELQHWSSVATSSKLPRERPTIKATSYMILRSPAEFTKKNGKKALLAAAKVAKHQSLWDIAFAVIDDADKEFAEMFTAIAFTHNFDGSPHIDTQNIGPFYGLGLGDYYDGGELCVESGVREVSYCDTRGRLAKVDGRYPHWVTPYKGTRYSVIYYQTLGTPTPMGKAVLEME